MSKDYTNVAPEGWKSFDQFVVDMTTYRLPATTALAGRELTFDFEASTGFPVHAMSLRFEETQIAWASGERQGQDEYEAIMVAPDVYFVSFLVSATNTECHAVVFNTETRRAVHVHLVRNG